MHLTLCVCKVTPRLSSNADVDMDGWRQRSASLVPVILLKIAAWGACALVAFFMQSLCLRACMVFVHSPQQADTAYSITSIILTFSVYNILLGDTVTC